MRVVQIVPPGPAGAFGGGVADFAAVLGGALAARHGVASRTLALGRRSRGAVFDALAGERAVLVHYANYGYAARGNPRWLVAGLARWRAAAPERRLGVVFHELWGDGPPWTSSYWLRPLQQRLAFALARRADAASTSLALYARLLAPARAEVEVRAIPSTIGEGADLLPFEDRSPRLIVFGGRGVRERAFGPFAAALARAAEAFDASEIWNVGPPLAAPPSRLAGRHVISTGALEPEELRSLFARSRYGFVAYPPAFLGKSSIFAAYSAHGLATAVAWHEDAAGRPGEGPEIEAGVHFVDPAAPTATPWTEIAAAARGWYLGHDLAVHADAVAAWISR